MATSRPRRNPERGTRSREEEIAHGAEGSADRVSYRYHDRLAEQLVREQGGLRRPAARGREDPEVHQEEVPRGGAEQDPDRPDAGEGDGLRPRRPGRGDHRQEGGGGREADQEPREPDAPGDRGQDDRGQPA